MIPDHLADAGKPMPTALMLAALFERYAIDHEPDGWPAIRQAGLSDAAAELRRLHDENEALKAAQYECGFGAGCCYQAAKSEADEALLRQALDCLTYTAPRHDCIDAAAEYERMSEATITALKERLK